MGRILRCLAIFCFITTQLASAVPSDSKVQLYALNAEQGDPEAQYKLGWSYLTGYETLQVDISKGAALLSKTADFSV